MESSDPSLVRRVPLILMVVAISACASSQSVQPQNPDVITRQELDELHELTAHAAIVRLRPRWLLSRGMASMRGAVATAVMIDGTERGTIDRLRSLQVSQVRELRYLDAGEATQRYGTGFPGGLILVLLHGR